MIIHFDFGGLLSKRVSLCQRKSQALTADRGLNEKASSRLMANLPSEHRTRLGHVRTIEGS